MSVSDERRIGLGSAVAGPHWSKAHVAPSEGEWDRNGSVTRRSQTSGALRFFPGALGLILIWCAAGAAAASPVDSLLIPPDRFLLGWEKSGPLLRFERNDLYGYIDGGAELFLEFGFRDLLVQQYARDSAELTLEVFRMEQPASALGIYLMRRGGETPIAAVQARNSGNRWQLLATGGSYFAQVNNFGGDSALLPVMAMLANRVLASPPLQDSLPLFDFLPIADLIPGSARLIRGPYALQPIFTFGEGDVFQLGGKIFGVAGDYADTTGDTYTRIIIPYPNDTTARAAYDNLEHNLDPTIKVLLAKRDGGFIFQDFQAKFGKVELQNNVLEIVVNLARKP